jgi:hypothetical protein
MGGVGSGQLTKLLNNALAVTNLKNAVDVCALAKNLGIDIMMRCFHERAPHFSDCQVYTICRYRSGGL